MAELKELIAMHSNQHIHGGDLKTDTVTIIGATLDLQEKVVRQVPNTKLIQSDLINLNLFIGHDAHQGRFYARY
jgi:hypothetical protein